MSSSEPRRNPLKPHEYSSFDLEYYIDREPSPTELTVCSTESVGTIATEWITIDIDHAISVEDIQ